MILRELIAVFGLDYDSKGQKEAERGIDSLKKKWGEYIRIASTFAGAAAALTPLLMLAKMGSDAQEVMNLLSVTFEDNAEAVSSWARETGPAIGRSINTMTELAAEFGGLLRPMVGANEELMEMSTNLAEVAVDLSSLRNITEKEAMEALRSGLSGSTIAVRRFGVDLRMARVEAEAFRMGINKSTKDMTQGELAAVRYRLIMKDLEFVQGDAAKTQWDFANSSRAFRDNVKDIGTAIGLFLVPGFEDILKVLRSIAKPLVSLIEDFTAWSKETNLAIGLLSTLGAVLAAVLLPPIATLLVSLLPLILTFAALTLVMDDVITAFQGGSSVVGWFAEKFAQFRKEIKEASPVVSALMVPFDMLFDVIGAVVALIASLIESISAGNLRPFERQVQALADSFLAWVQPLRDALGYINKIAAKITKFAVTNNPIFMGAKALGLIGPDAGESQAVERASLGPTGGRVIGGGEGRRTVTVNSGGNQRTFNIYQQPGESAEAFVARVEAVIDNKGAERDLAIQTELAPEPAG